MLLINRRQLAAFIMLSLLVAFTTQAADNDTSSKMVPSKTEEATNPSSEAGKFNAGEMIIEHVIDSHEWHILTWKGHSVSIPLPIILLDRGKLVVFSSAHLHHGTEAYNGYKLETEGPNKGKIVKVKEDGLFKYTQNCSK